MELLAVAYDAVPLFETLKDSLFHISALLFDVAKVVIGRGVEDYWSLKVFKAMVKALRSTP